MNTETKSDIPSYIESLKLFLRSARLIRPFWTQIRDSMILGLLASVLTVVSPILTKVLVDSAYPAQDFSLVEFVALGGLLLAVTASVGNAIRAYYLQLLNGRLLGAASLLLFDHLQRLRIRFFEQHRIGELTSRFADLSNSLQQVSRVFETLCLNATSLLLIPPIMMVLSWKLTLLSIASLPATVAISALAGRTVRRHTKRSAESFSELNALNVELLSNIRTIKAYTLEDYSLNRMRKVVESALSAQLHAGAVGISANVGGTLVRSIASAIFLWYSWTLVLRGEITLGSFLAFTAYVGFLTKPVSQLAALALSFQTSAVTFARAFEYLDLETERSTKAWRGSEPKEDRELIGNVELREVSLNYGAGVPSVKSVSVVVRPGEIVAIVGPSGAGKSSLLKLIACLEDPSSGEVLFDGVPATHYDLYCLRSQIAVVWQETPLMFGTLLDNITLGAPNPDMMRVEHALDVCQLRELVRSLPMGLNSPVAEWGATLSGGQRQRIALARAVFRKPQILLLDEVTSNLDADTERSLINSLKEAVRGQTVILVTHRELTAAIAGRVLRMEDGELFFANLEGAPDSKQAAETTTVLSEGPDVDEAILSPIMAQ